MLEAARGSVETIMQHDQERYGAQPSAPFGAWLLKQTSRGGFVGQFAVAATGDRRFLKAGDPEAVRAYGRKRPLGSAAAKTHKTTLPAA